MNKKNIDKTTVRLPRLFGLAPERWFPTLMLIALAIVALLLLVLPGWTAYGTLITFSSTPTEAALYIDDVRVGNTPLRLFVPAGMRDIEMRRPYHLPYQQRLAVRGRRIGSLLVPRRQRVHQKLLLDDSRGLTTAAAHLFAQQAMIGETTAQYQFVPILTTTAAALLLSPDRQTQQQTTELLNSVWGDVAGPALLKDYLHASTLQLSQNQAASPLQLLQLAHKGLQEFQQSSTRALTLVEMLPVDTAARLSQSDWFKQLDTDWRAAIAQSPRILDTTTSDEQIAIANLRFVRIPAASFTAGQQASTGSNISPLELPYRAEVDTFYIMSGSVTQSDYRQFLAENPRWRLENSEQLRQEGLVDQNYLAQWPHNAPDDWEQPISGVSWHSAQAFAQWLETLRPPSLRGWQVRLPRSVEWEWAVTYRSINNRSPISQIDGSPWLWMENWYRPNHLALSNHQSLLPAATREVRGDQLLEENRDVTPSTRGSQPPHWTSPYLGFRLVLIPE